MYLVQMLIWRSEPSLCKYEQHTMASIALLQVFHMKGK